MVMDESWELIMADGVLEVVITCIGVPGVRVFPLFIFFLLVLCLDPVFSVAMRRNCVI